MLKNVKLFPYQREGVEFLKNRKEALLYDIMGLGKSLQILTTCEETLSMHVLYVTRALLKKQVADEVAKFTDSTYMIISGDAKQREEKWLKSPTHKYVICNYEALLRDAYPFTKVWDVVIFDEASKLKNYKSKINHKVRELKATRKYALTGTPVENSPIDLYGVFACIKPNLFFSFKHFAREYVIFQDFHFGGNSFSKPVAFKNLLGLKQKMQPYSLRRSREDVDLQLPEFTEQTIPIEQSIFQRNVFNNIKVAIKQIIQELKDADEDEQKDLMGRLISCTTALRLCSISPLLLRDSESTMMNHLIERNFKVDNEQFYGSNKIEECFDLIHEANNSKVIVFTCFEKVVSKLSEIATSLKINHVVISGEVDEKQRNANLTKFKTDSTCNVLFSTDAGAYGLNLQETEYILHLDNPWNPAVIQQRNDRVRRIGQRHPVTCYYLVTENSFDKNIHEILMQKKLYQDVFNINNKQLLTSFLTEQMGK